MRLPWIQMADDAFERAVEVAALLGVPDAQALGHFAYLWRWCLSRPDDKLSGIVSGDHAVAQIEAGARWTGKRGALVGALEAVGLVGASRHGDNYRIKGLDRYRATVKHRQDGAERMREYRAKKRASASRLSVVSSARKEPSL